jgi:hypothetical protein
MTPTELSLTIPLLGVFVLFGGCYGLFYSIGQLYKNGQLIVWGYVMYILQCLTTATILALTPLAPLWKLFIIFSCLTYFIIPSLTWRYLKLLHHSTEAQP